MTKQKLTSVIGPPGTGKTSRLMDVLEDLLKPGRYSADEVAAVSFTKAAVKEIRSRVEKKLGLDLQPRSGGKIGTIHSLCFWGLNAQGRIFGRKEWREFCEAEQVEITEGMPDDDDRMYEPWEPPGSKEGDVFLAWYDWARNGLLDLEGSARRYDPGNRVEFSPRWALRLAERYEAAKARLGKWDFCDLLQAAVRQGVSLRARVLLVDEAQDLSPLQRQVVEMWESQAEQSWRFFDPNQCIYSWQHADPTWLLEDMGETEFLAQSWRVPSKVAAEAQRLIKLNRHRYGHEFKPRPGDPGEVKTDCDLHRLLPQIAKNGESWGLLARHVHLLPHYTARLLEEAIPYINLRGRSPLNRLPRSVLAAAALANGGFVTLSEVLALANAMPARGAWRNRAELERQAKAFPSEIVDLGQLGDFGATLGLINRLSRVETAIGCLTKLDFDHRSYYVKAIKKSGLEVLERPPAVTVSTIHGVKGREFDNVVIMPDWTTRTLEAEMDDPEPERRCWYVALTRARKRVFVLEPQSRRYNWEIA